MKYDTTHSIYPCLISIAKKVPTYIMILAFISILGIFICLRLVDYWVKSPVDVNGKPMLIDITSGMTLNKIASRLEEEGLINNRLIFSMLARIVAADKKPKAGEYLLSPAMSTIKILDAIVEGRIYLHSVTIPEGLNMYEIAELLEKKGMADKAGFIKLVQDKDFVSSFSFIKGNTLEGYLFPSTYLFRKGVSEKEIVEKMLGTFKKTVFEDIYKKAGSVGLTHEEVVIMASMVEKETGLEDEMGIISSVFHNRLKKNMKLQCDPTVIYAIKDFDGNLHKKDLYIDSPYNTYRYGGLPPGPITNPGKASILSVLNPSNTDYLYFVANKKGGHYFSSDIKEHNRAVRKYQLRK